LLAAHAIVSTSLGPVDPPQAGQLVVQSLAAGGSDAIREPAGDIGIGEITVDVVLAVSFLGECLAHNGESLARSRTTLQRGEG